MSDRLSEISCNAAVGLDNHLLGRATDEDYTKISKLASYLEDCVEQKDGYGLLQGDSNITSIMWKAFDRDSKYAKEVLSQTSSFYKRLEGIKQLRNQELIELRELCVKISKEAIEVEVERDE